MGLRTLLTRADRVAPERLGDGWVGPMWLERQLDPVSPSFLPQGHSRSPRNIVDRSWTGIGNIGSPHRAVVDPRGLLNPRPGGWSVDWWIGAEDRWHFPSRERTVRQELAGLAPVVETAIRVPGGDAICRAYTVIGPDGAGDLAVVEVENRAAVPCAVAFAIRPFNVEALVPVHHITLGPDHVVRVDGLDALYLPRAPARAIGSDHTGPDVAHGLSRLTPPPEFRSVRCRRGLAQAAFVFPLSHTASVRVAIPLRARPARPRRARAPQGALPSSAEVTRAWTAQARRGTRLVIPPGRVAQAVEASRKALLLSFAGDDLIGAPWEDTPPDPFCLGDLISALGTFGFSAEAGEALTGLLDRQLPSGGFDPRNEGAAAAAASVAALAGEWRRQRDPSLISTGRAPVALAARLIARRSRPSHARAGALADLTWSWRGLTDAEDLLRAAGDEVGAASASSGAAACRAAIEAALEHARPIDALRACEADETIPDGYRRLDELLGTFRGSSGPAVLNTWDRTGLSPRATLRLARLEAARGDALAMDRIRWAASAASDTFSWPQAIHPTQGGGTAGEGHDLRTSALFLLAVRSLLVHDPIDTGNDLTLVLCPLLPAEWEGQEIEMHDAPTSVGELSFAVRWHGANPALLWELRPHAGLRPVTVRAPGLDPSWSSTEPKGEQLLGAMAADTVPLSPPVGPVRP